MFIKVDELIGDCDGTKYLASFGPEKYDTIFFRVRYLIEYRIKQKSKLIQMMIFL